MLAMLRATLIMGSLQARDGQETVLGQVEGVGKLMTVLGLRG